jgi:hypothetical protein
LCVLTDRDEACVRLLTGAAKRYGKPCQGQLIRGLRIKQKAS